MAVTPQALRERLQGEVLVADGAMGTVLQASTPPIAQPYDYAVLTQPDAIAAVHAAYVNAGARIIETSTFGANGVKLSSHGLADAVPAINAAAVRLARSAAPPDVLVAGAMGPCGKALAPVGAVEPELAERTFREQATALLDAGIDLFLLETFNDIEELRIAYRVVRDLADIAVIAEKVFIEDGSTLDRGLPARIAAEVGSWPGIVAVGANCAIGPQRMVEVVRAMASATDAPIVAMPTPGLPQRVGGAVRYSVTPEYFAHQARLLVEAGASVVGGCCGTTPEHIQATAALLRDLKPPRRLLAPRAVVADREAPVAAPPEEHSRLRAVLGKRYVKAVELDLPRGLDMGRVVEGARALSQRGVDVINISDGARARLRMSPLAAAHLIQTEAGAEVMMHFACRDRNLLAIQADLLAAHALGIRNILSVTGDPAVIGDYPEATSVFDVDSVGLIRILRRFNEAIDLAGNSIGQPTAFTIGAAFDPLAVDPAQERERLARKRDEGAHVLYTQPIFDRRGLEVAAEAAGEVGLPLLFGLLPLRSARHCEFLHNEVPGIRIPDEVRKCIGGLSEEDARRYGVDVAQAFLSEASHVTQGVYLMPPFGNHRVAEAVLSALPADPVA